MVNIERINELARKQRTVGLTDEEIQEQKKLRDEYRKSVTGNLISQLENTYFVDKDGNKTKLKRN